MQLNGVVYIGNNKKSILNNRVLIYIPNRKNSNENAVISCVLSQKWGKT
jgi:hypothetical protein